MKTLLSENGGYRVYVELNDFVRSNGSTELKFISTYDSSKNPEYEQTKFAIILTPEQRRILKDIL